MTTTVVSSDCLRPCDRCLLERISRVGLAWLAFGRSRQMRSQTQNRRSEFSRDKKRAVVRALSLVRACVVAEVLTWDNRLYKVGAQSIHYRARYLRGWSLDENSPRPRRRARGAHSKKTRYAAEWTGGP